MISEDQINGAKHYISERIGELWKEKMLMVNYQQSKISVQDWHGVADAAMDIREIERELRTLQRIQGMLS